MQQSQLYLPPLSLYVHIPWCVKKCPYCDFNSHIADKNIPEKEYLAALIEDLDRSLNYVQGRKISSIFFGGGTPSLFSADAIGKIIQAAKLRIGFDKDIEITLEANPGTFEQEKFSGFRSQGVNRLSIGIQSFSDDHLESLGRIHSAQQAIDAVKNAKNAGFENINIDLMHGLPGQDANDAVDDLVNAIKLEPSHISWYQLTIEPNTVFFNKPPKLPTDILLESIQNKGEKILLDAGYKKYEVSAYCKNNDRSMHNMNYWEFGDYLGIGAGAHGKITLPEKKKILRMQKTRSPSDYLDKRKSYTAASKQINSKEIPLEFMMNALRLNHGVSKSTFEGRTGVSINEIERPLRALKKQKLIESLDEKICPTTKGHMFLNSVLEVFLEN